MISLLTLKHWHALRTHALAQLGWLSSRKSGESTDFCGPVPWWSYSCTHFLDQVVPRNSRVLELGGGYSTIWWLARESHVTTFETNKLWEKNLRLKVKNFHLEKNWDLFVINQVSAKVLDERLKDKKFDVIVVDHEGDRVRVASILEEISTENTLIIWDNSDRAEYFEVLDTLTQKGFKRLDFFGLSPINAYCTQTTILSKKFPDPVNILTRFQPIKY